MLEVRELCGTWGQFSLKEISFSIERGEYFVLLGPTGAGKTLLLETIAGFHLPSRGQIRLDGRDITGLPPQLREVGFVYQDALLFPHLTVKENLRFGLRVKKVPKQEATRRLEEVSELLGLSDLLHRMPRTLSGGEKQKVALGRVLVLRPKLLLLDEPLAHVDKPTSERLISELRRVQRETGITTLHVTHDREEALGLAQRMGILLDGRLVRVGEPEEVFTSPASPEVAEFLGVQNIFRGRARPRGRLTSVRIGRLHLLAAGRKAGEVTVCLRPQDIILSRRPARTSGRNVLLGRILDLRDRGAYVWVSVQAADRIFHAFVTRASVSELRLREGSRVYLIFKASAVHLI